MTTSAAQAFADAAAAVVNQEDVADTLAKLLGKCAELTGHDALGLLVRTGSGHIELLAATSHQATELELYQLQHDEGPCLESIGAGQVVTAVGEDEISVRWGLVGEAVLAAGFRSVYAAPLRWRGETIGGLNAFATSPHRLDPEQALLTQAFADVATIVIVQTATLSMEQLNSRISAALEGRTIVEQAKGVLAFLHDVDMPTAYRLLQTRAADSNTTLSETAARIVARAAER